MAADHNLFYARRYAALLAWLRGGLPRDSAGARPAVEESGQPGQASKLDSLSHADLVATLESELGSLKQANRRLDADAQVLGEQHDAIRKSEIRYRTAFQVAPVALAETDAAGTILTVNHAMAELINTAESELEGKPLWHLAGSEKARERLRDFLNLQEVGRPPARNTPLWLELRRADGSTIEAEIAIAHRAADAKAHGSLVALRDVSDVSRREAEIRNSANAYRDLFDGAPVMLLAIDAKTTTILECNAAVADATGYTRDELLGLSIFDLYDPGCLEQAAEAFRMFLRHGHSRGVKLRIHHKSGTTFAVTETTNAVVDEHGAILVCRMVWHELERVAVQRTGKRSTARLS